MLFSVVDTVEWQIWVTLNPAQLSIPTGMQPRKLTFGLNWCWGKAPQVATLWNMLSGPKLPAARQHCQPCSSCPGKKKDAPSSTVWCWRINPGKWADNGSFWLLPWLMRATVADSSRLPRMKMLKYSDSATLTQTLKLANMVRLYPAEQVSLSFKKLFL